MIDAQAINGADFVIDKRNSAHFALQLLFDGKQVGQRFKRNRHPQLLFQLPAGLVQLLAGGEMACSRNIVTARECVFGIPAALEQHQALLPFVAHEPAVEGAMPISLGMDFVARCRADPILTFIVNIETFWGHETYLLI
ncbi:hypothetical protein D1872_256430 [compost metagenome]